MSVTRWLLLGALGVSSAAHAQLTALPGESRVACLSRAADAKLPVYPERQALLREGGTVRLHLIFVKPDSAPKMEVTYSSGNEAFADAALQFARSYRLPCMAADAPPVVATQEFQFVPGDGRKVISGPLRDDPQREEWIRCVTGLGQVPDYPIPAFASPPEGTVILQMTFVDGTSAPQTRVVFDGGSERLSEAALAVVRKYRAPCLGAGATPVATMQSFVFAMSDTTRYVLKDLQLRQFVLAVDKLDQYPVRFDFSTMSCPFDVRLRLLQPHAPNQVGEIEHADPNRREFLEWLKRVSLKLPQRAARQVVGQELTVSVPCGLLDLT